MHYDMVRLLWLPSCRRPCCDPSNLHQTFPGLPCGSPDEMCRAAGTNRLYEKRVPELLCFQAGRYELAVAWENRWNMYVCIYIYTYLVGGLEHFLFSHVFGLLIIPIDFPIFQRGGPTTNQIHICSEIATYCSQGFWILDFDDYSISATYLHGFVLFAFDAAILEARVSELHPLQMSPASRVSCGGEPQMDLPRKWCKIMMI